MTWEYPPRIVGELAHYAQRLATALSGRRVDVSVITFHDAPYLHEKNPHGPEVHRLPNPVGPHVSVVTWALSLTPEVQRVVANIRYDRSGRLDLVDVHDWHFVAAAAELKKAFHLPFLLTLHSLEDHRSSDTSSPLSACIRGLEWLGAYECEAIIAGSSWMEAEVERIHQVPSSKVRTIRPDSPSWVEDTQKVYREALR